MRYITRQPPEYVCTIQAMKAWLDQEYEIYQLPTVLRRIIWLTMADRLHTMVDDLIRYNVLDQDQLQSWDDLPINEFVGGFFDTPYPLIPITKLYHQVEGLALDGNTLATMLYRPGYPLRGPLMTTSGSTDFIQDIAYNTSELLQSAIDYYRPMETLKQHYQSPIKRIKPEITTTQVDDPSRSIILRVE